MKKLMLFSLITLSAATHGASNIIEFDKLMFHSVVSEHAQEELAKQFPEYAAWLSDTDILLLLNFVSTTDKTVIVKFSADWCAPCKRLAPIVHEAAKEYGNDIVIIEVNIDKAPTLRHMFAVEVVPTLIYFKNGMQVDRTNSVTKNTLLDKIERLINQKSIAQGQ